MGFVETMTVTSASLHTERIVEAPAAITVISKEQIARKAAYGQIPKLVEFTPGVNVTQSGLYDYNVNTRGFNSSLKPAGGHPHPFSYSWFDFQPQADIPPGFEPLLAPNTLENTFRAGLGYITDRWDADFAVRWVDDFRWSVGVFQGDVESYTSLDLNANFRVVEHWKIFLTTAYDGGKRISVLCFRRSDGGAVVGSLCTQGHAGESAPEKWTRLGNTDNRRCARLRVSRKSWPCGGGPKRQDGMASALRRDTGLPRRRGLSPAL